ncbi:GNAT family N-acetyltransferase [bacterium]|nr:GNAT family N-acetyltransferase [bacterium]
MGRIDPQIFTRKDGGQVLIRTAEGGDARRLLEIGREVMAEREFTLTEPDELNLSEKQETQWIEGYFKHPSKLILLAEIADEVVGIIDFSCGSRRRNSHTGEFGMSVVKKWRHFGVGEALLRSLLIWAEKSDGIEKVSLAVHATNEHAISLYRKLGFEEEGRKKRDVRFGPEEYTDSILMSRFVK